MLDLLLLAFAFALQFPLLLPLEVHSQLRSFLRLWSGYVLPLQILYCNSKAYTRTYTLY